MSGASSTNGKCSIHREPNRGTVGCNGRE